MGYTKVRSAASYSRWCHPEAQRVATRDCADACNSIETCYWELSLAFFGGIALFAVAMGQVVDPLIRA